MVAMDIHNRLTASDCITKLAIQQVIDETPRRVLLRWAELGWHKRVRNEDYVWSPGKPFGFSQAKLGLRYDVRQKLQRGRK